MEPGGVDRVTPLTSRPGHLVCPAGGTHDRQPALPRHGPTREVARARPGDGLLCTAKWVSAETAFVLCHPDRGPVTVRTDGNCVVAVAGDRGHGLDFGSFNAFDRSYRTPGGDPPR